MSRPLRAPKARLLQYVSMFMNNTTGHLELNMLIEKAQLTKMPKRGKQSDFDLFFDKYSFSWHQITRKFEAAVRNLKETEINNHSFFYFVPT
jgi:hypothetical protein